MLFGTRVIYLKDDLQDRYIFYLILVVGSIFATIEAYAIREYNNQ